MAETDLLNRLQVHHGIRKFECHLCHKKFGIRFNLERHMNEHHDKTQMFKCDYCDKEFARKQWMIVHREVVHEELKFPCNICRRKLSCLASLQTHLRNIHKLRKNEQ
jgi:KRAB domain-containing zinc finger protein